MCFVLVHKCQTPVQIDLSVCTLGASVPESSLFMHQNCLLQNWVLCCVHLLCSVSAIHSTLQKHKDNCPLFLTFEVLLPPSIGWFCSVLHDEMVLFEIVFWDGMVLF